MQYVFGYAPIPLDFIFEIKNGYTPSKSEKSYWEDGAIPWFRLEDIKNGGRILDDSVQHINEKGLKKSGLFEKNSLIISTSATIGEYALIKVPFVCNQRFTCLTLKENFKECVDMEYILFSCYQLTEYCKEHLNQGNFASVDMKAFGHFVFNIPALEQQRMRVAQMKKMDAICNSLTEGLPAEIEARQKQYEYYRDKLLNMKRLEV